ncbi:MAG: DNA cytosine methyltransferase [Bacteroidetes bacterium]|nr:DNA cytosine methyltransferase [Bacteroidota bacterium]
MSQKKFIDLFAGCGGLSLGLVKSGWNGVFAIEKSEDAFKTFHTNFCQEHSKLHFKWPSWLPLRAMTTQQLLTQFPKQLNDLKGKIDMITGGPPCQGFSLAGLRNPNDPRNELIQDYIAVVRIVQPKLVLLENVNGINMKFPHQDSPYSIKIQNLLKSCSDHGYRVHSSMLNASAFGVPQMRSRYVMIAIRGDMPKLFNNPFDSLSDALPRFLKVRGLTGAETMVRDAISDLEINNRKLKSSVDTPGFFQIPYDEKHSLSTYQQLMRQDVGKNFEPNSLRLANHRKETQSRFQRILHECPKGVCMSKEDRKKFGLKKQSLTPLHPEKLAGTVTTIPDDMIHYHEPRVLTVRENARLQSFPDWFNFEGKYTTGGHRRRHECPRYTQVGNAVPPLMAEAIGETLLHLLAS